MNEKHGSPWDIRTDDFPASGTLREQMRFLLGYAILAPSGHNTQPWLFAVRQGRIDMFADSSRALPVVDPHNREMAISCGAALGLLEIAARRFGLQAEITYSKHVHRSEQLASVRLVQGHETSQYDRQLFDAILNRRTNRTLFTMDSLPEGFAQACPDMAKRLNVEAKLLTEDVQRASIAALVAQADRYQFKDPKFRRELADWVRAKSLGHRDGLSAESFGIPDIMSAVGGLAIRTFDMGDGVAAADENKILFGSPALLVLGSQDELAGWLNTGRALALLSLVATIEELGLSYLNQPIELDGMRPQLQRACDLTTPPQMLLRLGFPETKSRTSPTPRRDLADVLIGEEGTSNV